MTLGSLWGRPIENALEKNHAEGVGNEDQEHGCVQQCEGWLQQCSVRSASQETEVMSMSM